MIKIVLASILKPIDDTRMFEKFGLSLIEASKYEVNIIGFYSKNIPKIDNIVFHPLFRFKRISLHRVFAPIKYYKKLLKVKPALIIVNTHELLIVTIAYKILFGCKIIYDIQENYLRNTKVNTGWPFLIRPFLAIYIRLKEYICSSFISHFILAEKGYERELSFLPNRYTVLENKYRPLKPTVIKENRLKNQFIFTGTISHNYGIMKAIDFFEKASKINTRAHFTIIGYCQDNELINRITKKARENSKISLIGITELVPHEQIIKCMGEADIALCPYQIDQSIENCIPTKFYEYMAHELPIIIPNHKPWRELCSKYNAAISLDFSNYSINRIINQIDNKHFYSQQLASAHLWESEGIKLKGLISSTI